MNASAVANEAEKPQAVVLNPLHEDYFESIYQDTPIICGLRMKPISIGRYRMMARLKLAFVSDDQREAQARDLWFGVIICSMTCAAFNEFSNSKGFEKEMRRFGERYGFLEPGCFRWPFVGRWFKRVAERRVAEFDANYLQEQMELFKGYIASGAPDLSAKFMTKGEEGEASASHWSQNVESVLREYQGWTKEEIEERPLANALFDFYKHLENKGVGRFLTMDEIADQEKVFTAEDNEEMKAWSAKMIDFLKEKEKAEGINA